MPSLRLSFRGAQLKEFVLKVVARVSQNRTLGMNYALERGKSSGDRDERHWPARTCYFKRLAILVTRYRGRWKLSCRVCEGKKSKVTLGSEDRLLLLKF